MEGQSPFLTEAQATDYLRITPEQFQILRDSSLFNELQIGDDVRYERDKLVAGLREGAKILNEDNSVDYSRTKITKLVDRATAGLIDTLTRSYARNHKGKSLYLSATGDLCLEKSWEKDYNAVKLIDMDTFINLFDIEDDAILPDPNEGIIKDMVKKRVLWLVDQGLLVLKEEPQFGGAML